MYAAVRILVHHPVLQLDTCRCDAVPLLLQVTLCRLELSVHAVASLAERTIVQQCGRVELKPERGVRQQQPQSLTRRIVQYHDSGTSEYSLDVRLNAQHTYIPCICFCLSLGIFVSRVE